MKTKTLLVSSLFKKNKKYLNQLINSINIQSDQEFDILFTIDRSDYNYYLEKLKTKKIIFLKEKLPITLNKYRILNKIKTLRYENIIFQDSDDTFDKDRVRVSKKLLLRNDFVIGDIILKKRKIFSDYFRNNQKILINDLLKGNIAGYGNIGFRKDILTKRKLEKLKNIPSKVSAIDWITWLIFLQGVKKIIFSSKIKVFYNNRALSQSSLRRINLSKFRENIKVQYETFKNLSKFNRTYKLRFHFIQKNYIKCETKKLNQIFKVFKNKYKKIWFYLPI